VNVGRVTEALTLQWPLVVAPRLFLPTDQAVGISHHGGCGSRSPSSVGNPSAVSFLVYPGPPTEGLLYIAGGLGPPNFRELSRGHLELLPHGTNLGPVGASSTSLPVPTAFIQTPSPAVQNYSEQLWHITAAHTPPAPRGTADGPPGD
jgi:hypothetical protein